MLSRWLGYSILPAYLVLVLLVGWRLRRRSANAADFLNAHRSQPLWIVVLSFLAANCGALEIVGMSAVAAQYGTRAFHFYWIGAIPGMAFLGAVMLPIYMRSGARSLPEYLELRYDRRVRLLNSWLVMIASSALSGIGLYAMAQVLHAVYGWPFTNGALLAASVVLIYVTLGGLRATLYNQILQLAVIVAGLLPLLVMSLAKLSREGIAASSTGPLWSNLAPWSTTSDLDLFGVVIGLGFVLSFSYWCTDFVQMQRALTARTIEEGRMVPLLAGFGKLFFSMLIVLPALGAASVLGSHKPASFDQTMPALMVHSYGPIALGFGVTALMAGLMSHLAGNVSAFAALWTQEIYRTSLRTGASESHYLKMSRWATVAGIALSVANSYLAFFFRDLMEYMQMIFSIFGAPFFAIFLLGILSRRTTADGAVKGLASGLGLALAHQAAVMAGVLHYGSQMNANFHMAVYAFTGSLAVAMLASRLSPAQCQGVASTLVYNRADASLRASRLWWILAILLLSTCAGLNWLWR